MSATSASPGTPFRTLAAALCNGGAGNTTVEVVAGTKVASCGRHGNDPAGSFDVTFQDKIPVNETAVDVTPAHIAGGHNLNVGYVWDVTGQILHVSFAIDDGTLTDPAHFGVDVVRVTA